MKTFVKIMNFLRSSELNHRLFQEFVEELLSQYSDVLYHTEVKENILMTSDRIQPSIPQINVNSGQPLIKNVYLLVQPTASKFISPGYTSAPNSGLKINMGNRFSNSLPRLLTNVWVSGEPSISTSSKINFPVKTSNHKPVTGNKFQQLLLPVNHFLIQNLKQTNLNSKSQIELGKSEAQQVDKTTLDKKGDEIETVDISKNAQFVCSICGLRFWTKELLDLHLEGKQLNCRICFSEFSTHSELESHFIIHPNYKCIQCKEVFLTKKDLYHHRKDGPLCNPKLECVTCKKKYSSSKSLITHQKNVHSSSGAKCKCVVCNKMCILPSILQCHQRRAHAAYEWMECKFCNVLCLGPEKLKFHSKVCLLRKNETSPVPCPICGKVFQMENYMKNHIKYTHNDKNEILCEYCGLACKGRRSLINHIKHNHKGLKKYKYDVYERNPVPAICEICGKTLKSKYQLKTHLQIHSSERQFKCGICDATFKQEVALRNHNTTHSSVCKYNCSNCGKLFRWKHSFKKHEVKCK